MTTSLDLSRLFSGEVFISSGLVTEEGVDRLTLLSADALPSGFDNWAEKRRREFRCGRHHARLALEKAGAAASLVLRAGDGVPLFPPGYYGSITHTGRDETFAAAAVASTPTRVGIDAENQRPLTDDMMNLVLSEREIANLRRIVPNVVLPGTESVGDRALIAFSAKEAYYKCTYPKHRTYLGFHDVEFSLSGTAEWIADSNAVLGSFELRHLRDDLPEIPRRLTGRYLQLRQRVLCGVEWIDTTGVEQRSNA
jgi:4'-phosphopantetheinyl transferase EntD